MSDDTTNAPSDPAESRITPYDDVDEGPYPYEDQIGPFCEDCGEELEPYQDKLCFECEKRRNEEFGRDEWA